MSRLENKTGFFICRNYAGKGLRVFLLSGRRWTPALLAHYGIDLQPFFVRERRATEPEVVANGHPWGWSYTPTDAIKDEQRWLEPQTFLRFKDALEIAVSNAIAVQPHLEEFV